MGNLFYKYLLSYRIHADIVYV